MILRIASTLVMGIALLFGLEGLGIIRTGQYFPTLPRLDEQANTPGNWMAAGQWGLSVASCMTEGKAWGACTQNPERLLPAAGDSEATTIVWDERVDEALAEGSAANETPSGHRFTDRVSQQDGLPPVVGDMKQL